MGLKLSLLATFIPLALMWPISSIHASTITINFGNECQPLSGPGPILRITNANTFTCGDYTIEKRPGASDEARVDIGNDGSNDKLMFLDAKITKSKDSNHADLHITIKASTYQALPTSVIAQTDPSVGYKWSGTGEFRRNGNVLTLAKGSSLTDLASTQSDSSDPNLGTPNQAGNTLVHAVCDASGAPAGCVNTNSFSPNTPAGHVHSTSMSPPYNANPLQLKDQRLLTGDLTVKLISTTTPSIVDELRLTNLTLTDIPGGCVPRKGKPCKK
jgi:hypothetical protein